MITTVTLNPAIDKVVEIEHMSLGHVHRVSRQVVSFGGKSINVARILSGLSTPTEAVCFLGKKNYDEIEAYSKKDKLHLKPIMLEGLTRTNVKVVEPDQKYRTTDINEAGFDVTEDEVIEMTKLIHEQAKSSDFLVLSGSLPGGINKTYYKQLALDLKDVTKVIIDADGEVLMAGMEGAPYMIKPNIHELEAAVGREIPDESTIVEVCRELIDLYKMTYIMVSRGEEGCTLVGKEVVLSAGALAVDVVSTVGAGDSMLAGMIYGLTLKEEGKHQLAKALALGVASSAIAISTQDHKSIAVADLESLAKEVLVKEV